MIKFRGNKKHKDQVIIQNCINSLISLVLSAIVLISCNSEAFDLNCEISNLEVIVGECGDHGDYSIAIDFDFEYAASEHFDLFIRHDDLIGSFALADLPITIDDFTPSGLEYDFLEVCIHDDADCCAEIEFLPPEPECVSPICDVGELHITVGECTGLNTYDLVLDFEYTNADNIYFDVFIRDDELIGYFELADLPITLHDFEISGRAYDYIKVCINDNADCCQVAEFIPPDCTLDNCEVGELHIDIGECTSGNTYDLTLNFEAAFPSDEHFDVYIRNDVLIGYYALSDLPLTLQDFEFSGNDYDFIKVCINDNPDCCNIVEFMPPDCSALDCRIENILIDISACTSDSTYDLTIDFDYANAENDFFDVFIRNVVLLDYFALADLPVTIHDFELSGHEYDYINICINDQPNCCSFIEYLAPECE